MMATPGVDRYAVVRRPFGYIVSDQQKGEWIGNEHKSPEAAHRAADKLNQEARLKMTWVPDPDGEYNEAKKIVNVRGVDHTITVFSDRDGEKWCARIDDGEIIDLEATYRDGARDEAEALL